MTTELAEKRTVPLAVQWLVADATTALKAGLMLASQRLVRARAEDVHMHSQPHGSAELLIGEMVAWQSGKAEPPATSDAPRLAHATDMLIGCAALDIVTNASYNL